MKWNEKKDLNFTKENLNSLFDNEIATIRVKNFLTADECDILLSEIKKIGIDYYKGAYPKIGKIGITQFEYGNDKIGYFNSVSSLNKRMTVIHNIRNKVIKLLECMGDNEVSVAYETSAKQEYFAGLIRVINNSALLHIDYAPRDAKGWSIEDINAQLAWNIFIQTDEESGKGVVYNKPWEAKDEKYKIEASYEYSSKVVQNKEKIEYLPNRGDLVFHNSRNYHSVKKSLGKESRITLSSFVGRINNNELVLWN